MISTLRKDEHKQKITVSCPLINWNGEDTLEMVLESTKHVCDEYIFVDHSSIDKSISIIKKCEKKWDLNIRYFDFPRSVSQWEVRLFSFKQAQGDWILLTDSDHVFYNSGVLDIKNWVEVHSKIPAIWRIPLITLRYDLDRVAKKAEAPPHKLFYYNTKSWLEDPVVNEQGIVRDLPRSKELLPICVDRVYRVFNVTQQSSIKSLYRVYWDCWGRKVEIPRMTLDTFIEQKLEGQDVNDFAGKRFEELKAEASLYEEKKFGFPLPEVIKRRLGK